MPILPVPPLSTSVGPGECCKEQALGLAIVRLKSAHGGDDSIGGLSVEASNALEQPTVVRVDLIPLCIVPDGPLDRDASQATQCWVGEGAFSAAVISQQGDVGRVMAIGKALFERCFGFIEQAGAIVVALPACVIFTCAWVFLVVAV